MAELFTLMVLVSIGLAPVPPAEPPDPLGWGYLGVAPQVNSLTLGTVQPGTPADRAGLKVGDELLKVGRIEANDWQEITEYICTCRPGTVIQVRVRRDGKEKVVRVRIGTRPLPPELPVPTFRGRDDPDSD